MRNVFEYLEYSFFTLFSKKFGRIVGSSLFVDIFLSILSGSVFVYFVRSIINEYTLQGSLELESALLEILLLLLCIITIGFINAGWKLIIIPLRSNEGALEKIDIRGDLLLFRKHISYYFSYITWYSGILFLWIIAALIGGSALWYGEMYGFFSIYLFVMIIGLVILQIALTFTWYNSLLKPSYGLAAFRESISLTRGRKWQIFKTVFIFSFVIGLASGVISSLNSLLPEPVIENRLAMVDRVSVSGEKFGMKIKKEHIQSALPIIEALLPNLSVFYLLFRVEGVLSFAMIQIFLMQLTIDRRSEVESFKKKRDSLISSPL